VQKNATDEKISRLIQKAESSATAAAELLLVAANLLRANHPLPASLRKFLADAIESAMAKPVEQRVQQLGHELLLLARNRRKQDVPATEVRVELDFSVDAESESVSIDRIAKLFGTSSATIRRRLSDAAKCEDKNIEAIRKIHANKD